MKLSFFILLFILTVSLKGNYIVCFSLTDTVSSYNSIPENFLPNSSTNKKNIIIKGPQGYTYTINAICKDYKADIRYVKGFFYFDSNQNETTIQVLRKKKKKQDTLELHLVNPHGQIFIDLHFTKVKITSDLSFGKSLEDYTIQLPSKKIERADFMDYTCIITHSCKPAFIETDYYKEKKEVEKERQKKEALFIYEKRLLEINQQLRAQCEDVLKKTFPQEFITNYIRFKWIKPWYSGWNNTAILDTNHKSVYVTYTYTNPTSSLSFDLGIQASLNVPTLRGQAVADYDTIFITEDRLKFIEPEEMIRTVKKKFPGKHFMKTNNGTLFYQFIYLTKKMIPKPYSSQINTKDNAKSKHEPGGFFYIFVVEGKGTETLYYFDAIKGNLESLATFDTDAQD